MDSRGTLVRFDAEALPRSIAGFSTSVHLFETRDGLVRHALPFPFAPVSVLALAVGRKELQLDLLHHRARVGLFRTRFAGTLADGALTVSAGGFEVWDIGHAQIGVPDEIIPDPIPETRQFDPTGEVPLTASAAAAVAPGTADNTIGTHLTADLSREPVGFFGYTDAGDGGLRVIFAPDIPALSDPPPLQDEKVLRPDQVSGPHVPCEAWVEIPAADFVPSELPGYYVGIDIRAPSLGSTVEVAIDSIDLAVAQVQRPDGSVPNRILGLTDRDFDDLDAVRLIGPPRVVSLTADDARVVDVTLTPAAPVDGVPFQIDVAIAGVPVPALCAFTRVPPANALPVDPAAVPIPATGAPLTVVLPLPGRWTMSILLTDTAAGARADEVIVVGQSLRQLVWGIPAALYDRLEIARLHVAFLQYDLEYFTLPEEPRRVTINKAATRATEMRFLGAATPEQGTVDYQGRIAVDIPGSGTGATVGRIRGALSAVLEVKDLRLSFAYGRPFTAGVLMADQRAANTLTLELAEDRLANVITRTDPARHNAIAGKPIGSSATSPPVVQIRVETNLLTATLAAIATGLGLFGLLGLASWIATLYGLIALAGALGPWGAIVAATAAALLFVALVFVLPRAVEDVVRTNVAGTFAAGGPRENLDDAAFLRFGGEGMAEAICASGAPPGHRARVRRAGARRRRQRAGVRPLPADVSDGLRLGRHLPRVAAARSLRRRRRLPPHAPARRPRRRWPARPRSGEPRALIAPQEAVRRLADGAALGARGAGRVAAAPIRAAAFTSALNAPAATCSPSWMSIALRVPPSSPALKRPAGSASAAPLAKVNFTLSL